MGRRTRILEYIASLCLVVAATCPHAAGGADEPEYVVPVLEPAEVFTYAWRTSGLLSILLPRSGEARLAIERPANGVLRAELRLDTDSDTYWLTGSVIDAETLTAKQVWTSYLWHGRTRTRSRDVNQNGVVDMLATILTLRRDLPRGDTPLEFHTGSSVYPIVARRLPGGPVYRLEDREVSRGERWSKRAELSFLDDARRSPKHIALIETLIRIDLELVDGG